MKKSFSVIAFGEPLTEVFLKRKPNSLELKNQTLMSDFLRKAEFHATSGDVLNFLGNYACVKRLIGHKLGLTHETIGLLTATGNDKFGKNLKRTLLSLQDNYTQVNADLFRLVPKTKSGVYGVYVKDKKGNYEFYFDRFGYAFEKALNEKTLPEWVEIGAQARYFYTTGIALAMTKKYDLFEKLFRKLKSHKTKIIFDTNYRSLLVNRLGTKKFTRALESLYPYIDILLAGEGDLRNIYQDLKISKTDRFVKKFYDYMARQKFPKQSIVLKCGPKGVYYFGNSICRAKVPKIDESKCEDCILHPEGAGDAFNAGFMLRLIHGGSLKKSLQFGNLIASHKIHYRGCFREGIPFQKHVEKMINTWARGFN